MFDFLSKRFSGVFARLTGSNKLTEKNVNETLDKIQDALLEADIPYDVVHAFMSDLKKEIIGKKVIASVKPSDFLIKIVYEKLVGFLGGEKKEFEFALPATIMMLGLQGSGKTTTIGKMATYCKHSGQKLGKKIRILAGSVDFYRPAAIEQLRVIARNAGIDFYCSTKQSSVLDAAQDIYTYYKNNEYDILFLDTAGRMHIDDVMLEELEHITDAINPSYKILVLDSMTGQESLRVAKTFNERVGFDFAILTKMDSDTRGGAAFAFNYVLGKSVQFIGMGEKSSDLELFRPNRIASRILGMGDVETLSERINDKIKQADQDFMAETFLEGNFSLEEFAKQLDMVGSLGSLSSLLKYIPGASGLSMTPQAIEQGEQQMKLFRAVISSMTRKERLNPKLLDFSRKKRVAKGAGVEVKDVDALLAKFEQSKQFAKLFKKSGTFNNFFK